MTTPVSVLGVLGLCWVGFRNPTHILVAESVALQACVLGVLGLRAHARARFFLIAGNDVEKNPYASPKKPNTPNTLNSNSLNTLNSLSFKCVGFVLGCLIMCWVATSEGSR